MEDDGGTYFYCSPPALQGCGQQSADIATGTPNPVRTRLTNHGLCLVKYQPKAQGGRVALVASITTLGTAPGPALYATAHWRK